MYSEKRIIKNTDVNINRNLRSSSIFTIAQEVAMIHSTKIGMDTDQTFDKGILWVVARQAAQIYKIPQYEHTVTVETWLGNPMHMFFPRYTRFKDAAGNTLIEINAIWTLIDAKNRTTINIEDTEMTLVPEVQYGEFPRPKPIRKIPIEKSIEHTVLYSYTDMNGHFTNARYLDITENMIPEIASTQIPKSIKVEYASEVPFGEKFTLSYGHTDNLHYFSGDTEDRHKFAVQIEY